MMVIRRDPLGTQNRPFEADIAVVEDFSLIMIEKLRENQHKDHWHGFGVGHFVSRLRQEIKELVKAFVGYMKNPSAETANLLARECADVANFSMMIADNAIRGEDADPDAARKGGGTMSERTEVIRLLREGRELMAETVAELEQVKRERDEMRDELVKVANLLERLQHRGYAPVEHDVNWSIDRIAKILNAARKGEV